MAICQYGGNVYIMKSNGYLVNIRKRKAINKYVIYDHSDNLTAEISSRRNNRESGSISEAMKAAAAAKKSALA
jgi:PBP1b-binding outer membrane lipoprotein LpoB